MGAGFTKLLLDGSRSERQAVPADGDGAPPSCPVREEAQRLHARRGAGARHQQDCAGETTARSVPLSLEFAESLEFLVPAGDIALGERLQPAETEALDVEAGQHAAVDDGFAQRVGI